MKKKLTKSEKGRYVRARWYVRDRPQILEFLESHRLEKKVTDFDELVIGEWFHLERLGRELYWLRVGDREWEINLHDGVDVTEWRA